MRSYEDTWHETAQLEYSHITRAREKGGRTTYTSILCIDVIVERLTKAGGRRARGEKRREGEATEGG